LEVASAALLSEAARVPGEHPRPRREAPARRARDLEATALHDAVVAVEAEGERAALAVDHELVLGGSGVHPEGGRHDAASQLRGDRRYVVIRAARARDR